MSGRTLSYSRPAYILVLMLEGFITIEEGQVRYAKAGGKPADFKAFVIRRRRKLASDAEAGF